MTSFNTTYFYFSFSESNAWFYTLSLRDTSKLQWLSAKHNMHPGVFLSNFHNDLKYPIYIFLNQPAYNYYGDRMEEIFSIMTGTQ